MARNATVIQVFVASPADVQEERSVLESVIQELNQIWSKSLGIIFELVKWETHTYPAFGSDPQAIINEQIGDEYDVFVGILWARFGTPTPRAASGTLEEFERALERRKTSGNVPEVMVYIKDAPISPSAIDAEQFGRVSAFQKSLTGRGGYYSVFKDASGFETSLRAHLAQLAQNFSARIQQKNVRILGSQPGVAVQKATITTPTEAFSGIDDGLGFLDYIDIYQARIAEMTSAIETIGDATIKVGEQITQRTKEMEELAKTKVDIRDGRKIVKKSAENMSVYAEVLQSNIPLMSSSRDNGFAALTNALAIYEDFAREDKTDLVELSVGLGKLVQNASDSNNGLISYRLSVVALPRLTSEINKAKRAVIDQLDLMIAEIDKTIHGAQNIKEAVDAML
jgi:hypothetical protein